MKHYFGKGVEFIRAGFTDLFVLTAADLTVSTDDLLQNIALCTLQKGDVVFDRTIAEIITALDPAPSANAIITVSVGRTATAYTDILAAFTLMNSTATAAKAAAASGAAIGNQVIAADATVVYAQFDITDTDGHLSAVTTGEVHIWMCISRWAGSDGRGTVDA